MPPNTVVVFQGINLNNLGQQGKYTVSEPPIPAAHLVPTIQLFGTFVVPKKSLEEKTGTGVLPLYLILLFPFIVYNTVAVVAMLSSVVRQNKEQHATIKHIALIAVTQFLFVHHAFNNLLRAVLPIGWKTSDAISVRLSA